MSHTESADRLPRIIFAVTVGLGSCIALLALFVEPYFFQFYGDANSRLVQTRMIIDSTSPGLHWIGSVWLPLPQLLFLPFSLIDPLFRTGLAGFVVCMPLLGWSAVLMYRLLRDVTDEPVAAAIGALFFALNPNMLYISMTAMTETVTLFFFIASVQQWMVWLRGPRAGRALPLLLASLSAAAATLCRYEAWMFTAVLFVFTLVVLLRRRAPLARAGVSVALSLLMWTGAAFWLLWNHMQFGDAFYFNHAEYYSAAWQAAHRPVRAQYYLQFRNVLSIYSVTAAAIFGYGFLAVAAAGTALMLRARGRAHSIALALLLLVMPFFTLLSLFRGVAEMTEWWNSRYVLLASPFVSLAVATACAWWKGRGGGTRALVTAAAILFALTAGLQMSLQKGNVVTVADAAGGFYYMQTPHATAVAEHLRAQYRGGVLFCATGSGQSHRILQPSGIPTRSLVTGLNFDTRNLDLAFVTSSYEWVVVGLAPSPDGEVIAKHWQANAALLQSAYDEVLRNDYYIVYRKSTATRTSSGT